MNAIPLRKPEKAGAVSEQPVAERRTPARVEIPGVVPASRLEVRPAPAPVLTGIAEVDALTAGLPRGALTEVFGPASSGRTSLMISLLAAMTAAGEVCALVDASDSFAPECAQDAGVDLNRVLWVRCGTPIASCQSPVASKSLPTRNSKLETRTFTRLEQALKATDLLLQSGGFGLVAVDFGDIPAQAARRVPLTSWFRFRRAVEDTSTVLLVLGRESCAKTCASLVLQLTSRRSVVGRQQEHSAISTQHSAHNREEIIPKHAELLTGIAVQAELIRSRTERKPVRAVRTEFETLAQWA